MGPTSFEYFPVLPPELRFQIWETALSVRSVWAAVRDDHPAGNGVNSGPRPFTMTFVGPSPHLAGLSCKEAWQLLKRSYAKPIRGPAGSTKKTRLYWVDLDQTVVCLGNMSDSVEVLAGFEADVLAKFKHVALLWRLSQFGDLARLCQRFAAACPALRTIIIQWAEMDVENDEPLQQPLSPETAAYYADIPAHPGLQIGYDRLDMPYFRSLLLPYSGDSPPTLHLLAPESVRRLP